MTTSKQDEQFIAAVINDRLLEAAIEWIAEEFDPEDVFSELELQEWAENFGYTLGERSDESL